MKELEMILATVANLGAAGKEAFIWWLFFDKLIPGLIWLLSLFTILYGVWRIVATLCLPAQLRDAMGIGSPGPVVESEVREMKNWISERKASR